MNECMTKFWQNLGSNSHQEKNDLKNSDNNNIKKIKKKNHLQQNVIATSMPEWNAKNIHKIHSVPSLSLPLSLSLLLYLDRRTLTMNIPLQQYTYSKQLLAHFHFWHQPKAFPPHGTCWLHCGWCSCVNAMIFMYHFESVALNSNTIYTFTFTLGEASSDDLQRRKKKDDINRFDIPSQNDNQIFLLFWKCAVPITWVPKCGLHSG